MKAEKYAKIKMRDNEATIKKYVGGPHVKFLTYLSAIVDCDIQMEANRKNEEEYLLQHETKSILIKQFEVYCFLMNTELLK